jgi:hypothetical protein
MPFESRAFESLRRKSPFGLTKALESLSTDLVAAVAATPKSDRESLIAEIGRVIRSGVKAVDETADNHVHSRPNLAGSAVASSRLGSGKVRLGFEDLEDRVIPSIMTITITNHPTTQVQRVS